MLLCSKGAMLSEQGEICISAVSLKETRPPYFPLPTSAIPGGRWRLSSHGWFTLLISRSHRSWPWGRTAVVTTTSWPTLWVVIRRLPEGGQDLSYSACALTLTCMHSIWVPGFCVLKKIHHIFPLLSFLLCLFINHNVADRLNCVFPSKWMSRAINKEHSTFHNELCGAAISLSLPEEGNIHLALRI